MLPIPFAKHTTYPGHSGVDFPYGTGTLVRASGPGRIISRGWHNNRAGYGVVVQYDGGPSVLYCHFVNLNSSPGVGTRVNEGTVIGAVGSTGRSTGPHLHMEIMSGAGAHTNAGIWKHFTPSRVVGAADQDTLNRQRWLNQARGEKLVEDGIEGEATRAAYKRYQAFLRDRYDKTLKVDGAWGQHTQRVHQRYWDEVNKPKPAPAPKPQPAQKRPDPWSVVKGWNWNGIAAMLRRYYGYRGNNAPGPQMVSALQRFLKANYGYTGAIDGAFGDGTAAAVQRWLKAKYGYAGAIDSWMGGGTHEAWKRAEVANWHAFPGHRQQ